ncbi:Cys-tRNA(Pro) deacylase [candidate division KSB3 bacterium]|uniref:Cys-tRNA(Pro)/Cys-tRNA(Cys) deacylase n=1 Tax=candidate division KSB3 bacterium TaxID=2044937 RepID=A0A2G6E364_9BACT|nr:MAG: Cys-tRNA(Pro) deacylase [candidate division KSB3 bacterium]PIE28711.1 MAG: Cys-tRNA(Pro) deacylase [candidate division KSB3 bacterium]
MTPAIQTVKRARIFFQLHEYAHSPSATSYGKEAALKLDVAPERIFKTLVLTLDAKSLAVAVIPVAMQLNLKRFARCLGAKKAVMAEKKAVENSTGYVLGGVSPLGQKKPLPVLIDVSAKNFETIYVSAGRRGLQIELSPESLSTLTKASFAIIGK